ncbi:helix-turn-helix domain-containing protein [Paraburkholderia megapolitana]|uniref:Cytoskeleton protein RodZ n=1 Tax=Paraburkholderia megapolitana TaxID=420953 RepID=A0A1I3NIA7_9BURK|nr:RodZ domain-containing protein [Paraburkholderia megapolitana]QDQ84388.1 helix-turn-helix domain-containing protein [Paraburkholderia megapolitana]SFJ09011.1 cytoskeleton protein RodZ [Paraburkholderia megapolitana]
MSEPQHPQPQDTETNAGRPAPAVVQPLGSGGLDSLAALGARLTQLRESKGWTIDDVSARLKVAVPKLRALEAGDISHLPDTTFALGVVRSYARMLGADPAPFTQALRREKGVPEPDLSMPASSGRDLPRGKVSLSLGGAPRRRSWLWGIAAIVVAVIALAMWHTNSGESSAWFARLKASANGTAATAGDAASTSATVAQGQTAAADDTASTPDSQSNQANQTNQAASTDAGAVASGTPMPAPLPTAAAPASTVVAPVAQASQPAVAAAPASVATTLTASSPAAAPQEGEAIVAMSVNQDSWFSVRQNDGKELFSGLVHAGETKEVTGAAPFKITVGNKAGLASMTLDGQPVDPAKYSSARGNVARFALP